MFGKTFFMSLKTVAKEIRSSFGEFSKSNGNGVWFYYHWKREIGVELELDFHAPKLQGQRELLSYNIWYEFVEDFVKDFAISGEEDLYKIRPRDLVKRFETGVAKIYCCVDGNDGYLVFKKMVLCFMQWIIRMKDIWYVSDCKVWKIMFVIRRYIMRNGGELCETPVVPVVL
jgi:hypothetical protein